MTAIQPERSYMDPKEVKSGSEREAGLDGQARNIVEATARMGLCSQTHHEHLMADARRVIDRLNRSAAPTGASPDPSIPERPDRKMIDKIAAVLMDLAPLRYADSWPDDDPDEVGPFARVEAEAILNALGSIPERPAEPLREALTTILGIVEEASGSLPSLDRAAIERLVRAALQSTPESRDA